MPSKQAFASWSLMWYWSISSSQYPPALAVGSKSSGCVHTAAPQPTAPEASQRKRIEACGSQIGIPLNRLNATCKNRADSAISGVTNTLVPHQNLFGSRSTTPNAKGQ